MIFLITLIGLVLRLLYSNQSFWLDEGASLMFAKLSLPQLLESIKTDFHPPLFYGLLHFWLPLAGKSEWLIRLPFILISVATIPAIFLLCRAVFAVKSRVPVLSALFLALNPLHIYYSQELRMYSLATLGVVLSWYFLVKRNYLLAGVLNALSFFTFYGTLFSLASQIIFLLSDKSKKKYLHLLSVTLPVFTLFLFWWPAFSVQLENGNYLKSVLPGWQLLSGSLTIKSLTLIPLKFILGRISFQPQNLYLIVGGVLTIIFLAVISNAYRDKKVRVFWFATLGPIILAALLSLKTPVLGYWRFLYVLPFFLVLIASGIEDMPKIVFWGTTIWVCGVFLFSNLYFWNNPKFHREDWRGLTSFIDGKNSLVLLAFPYQFAPLYFYHTDALFLPMQNESYQPLPSFKALLEEKSTGKTTVFYLDYLADLTDPKRNGLNSLPLNSLKQVAVYNFNNLGQVYEFQPL